MILWARMFERNRCVKDMTITREETDTRTHKIFAALAEVCDEWNLAQPMWLNSNVSEFQRRSRTRFTKDNFIESIEFDYVEFQILEEDSLW